MKPLMIKYGDKKTVAKVLLGAIVSVDVVDLDLLKKDIDKTNERLGYNIIKLLEVN